MKKILFTILTMTIITIFSTTLLATDDTTNVNLTSAENIASQSNTENTQINSEDEIKELEGASEEIIGAVTEKDKKIAELSDKYNDKTKGLVAYYLERVRYYSTPIFFIFLTMGGFNFFIIGNKKLDKKEQGFGWITACIIGWVVFQCIPLIYALFAL